MRPNPIVLSVVLLACAEGVENPQNAVAAAAAKAKYHLADFRVDCTDDVCEEVVAVPLAIPEGAPAQWVLDGEPLPVEETLTLALETSELAELRLEVEHEDELWETTKFIVRSNILDEEGTVIGTGHHIIGSIPEPIIPNVVTFEDCEDQLVKVAVIGGCFQTVDPMEVFLTPPRFNPPQAWTDYDAPAVFDTGAGVLSRGSWAGARVHLGGNFFNDGATWSALTTGDRLELGARMAPLDRWLLIRAGGAVHENPIAVRCENNRHTVKLDRVVGKSYGVGP